VVEAAIEASVLDSATKREDRITYWRRAAAPPLASPSHPEATLEKETPHVSHSNSRWLAVIMLVLVVTLSACGGFERRIRRRPPPPPHRPRIHAARHPRIGHRHPRIGHRHGALEPRVDPGSRQLPHCRDGRHALGITVSKPIGVAGGWSSASGRCDGPRPATTAHRPNVIIELISNIDPTSISQFSSKFRWPTASVSGVGDQARSSHSRSAEEGQRRAW